MKIKNTQNVPQAIDLGRVMLPAMGEIDLQAEAKKAAELVLSFPHIKACIDAGIFSVEEVEDLVLKRATELEKELSEASEKLEKQTKELEGEIAEGREKLAKAKDELEKAKAEIAELKKTTKKA